MAWAENNYIETRFVGGMNCSVEPHTLDRDTGELPDIMNMVCRTQGLRTRKGFVRVTDLVAAYGTMPINAPTALFSFEYEPDLPPEETGGGEEGDDTGGGDIVPYIDGGGGSDDGGGGGGGNVKPKPEPEPEPAPEPSEAWSVSGPGSCYPYVPFDLTITRNSGTGSPTWIKGSLNPSSAGAYSGTHGRLVSQSSSSWKKQVRVNNLKRTINSVSYKAGATSSAYGECTVDYELYGFFPEIPDAVDVGVAFEYKVECRDMSVISNYQGNGRGMSMTWTLYDANGNPINEPVTTRGSSWTNGVLKGNATISSFNAVKVRLTTLFLGEEHYVEAAINLGDVSIDVDEHPNALHIYGEGSRLAISADGPFTPSHLSVACTIGGTAVNINDVLELATAEDGSRDISFASGWSEQNAWSKYVRAKSREQYAGETLRIVFSYQNGEDRYTATAEIDIEGTIIATLTGAPSTIYTGDTVTFTASISGNVDVGLDIDRVPFSSMFLSHADGDGFTVTPDKDITDGSNWSESGGNLTCGFSAVISGTNLPATLRYCLGMSNEVLAYADISVQLPNYAAMLAEAINERILAKTGTAGTYTENDGASTLRSAAISACAGYVNADGVSASGTATSYSDTGSGALPIDSADETVQWYMDAYNLVKQVKTRSVGNSLTIKGESVSFQKSKFADPTVEDHGIYIHSPSTSTLIDDVFDMAYDGFDGFTEDRNGGLPSCSYHWQIANYDNAQNTNRSVAYLTIYFRRMKFVTSSVIYVAGVITFYCEGDTTSQGSQPTYPFDSMGFNVVNSEKRGIMTMPCSAGSTFESDYIPSGIPDIPLASSSDTTKKGGFSLRAGTAFVEYNFTHKG